MRFLTYNIQAAIGAKDYWDYGINAHKQVMHTKAKTLELIRIARLIKNYDIVCLQEVDLGGLRSGFNSQAKQLQEYSKHPYMLSQINRRVGKLSLHGNMILSRYPLHLVEDIDLPSRLPGRGLLIARVEIKNIECTIMNTHLSLSANAQANQFKLIGEKLQNYTNVIVSGDFNCQPTAPHFQAFLKDYHLRSITTENSLTYPSWKPQKALDHIIVSPSVSTWDYEILPQRYSDHLAVTTEFNV